MEYEIIPAEEKHIEELCSLLDELFSMDIEFTPDRDAQKRGLKSIINQPDTGEILILQKEGKIIGMVSLLYTISTALGGPVAVLEDMIISKEFRKMGYGSALLKNALQWAQDRGILRVTLLTDYNNDIAIKYYEKQGFTRSAMIPMRLVFKEESSPLSNKN